jgi:hypothetical protein
VEYLELDDLQGISGLKALRVAVRMAAPAGSPKGSLAGLDRDFAGEEGSVIELIRREFRD